MLTLTEKYQKIVRYTQNNFLLVITLFSDTYVFIQKLFITYLWPNYFAKPKHKAIN